MGPVDYTSDHLTSTRVEERSGTPCDSSGRAPGAESPAGGGRPGTSIDGSANSARTPQTPTPRFTSIEGPGCAGCVFLREQIDILLAARGALIEANFALAARALRAESEIGRRVAEERHHAEFLTGPADLQRVGAGG